MRYTSSGAKGGAACASCGFYYETETRNPLVRLQTNLRKRNVSIIPLLSFCDLPFILACLLLMSLCGQRQFHLRGDRPHTISGAKRRSCMSELQVLLRGRSYSKFSYHKQEERSTICPPFLCYPSAIFLLFCPAFCYGHFVGRCISICGETATWVNHTKSWAKRGNGNIAFSQVCL